MKKIKVLLSCVVIIAISIVFVGCSGETKQDDSSDDTWAKVQDSGKLVVGLCAAYPPFESRNEKTGDIEGFDVDIANALGKELGVDVEIKDAEWQALLGGLNKGDFDILITCMSVKEAAVENVNMSDPYYQLNQVVVVKDDNNSIKSKDDLKDKVIGVQLGSASEKSVDDMGGFKEVKRYNYNPEAFIDLENDRIDAVVVGYPYAVNYLKENDGFKIIDDTVGSEDIVMVMRNGEDELTKRVNEALLNIKENGEYDKAIEKWLSV